MRIHPIFIGLCCLVLAPGCSGETVVSGDSVARADAGEQTDSSLDTSHDFADSAFSDGSLSEIITMADSPAFEDVKLVEGSTECIPDGSDGVIKLGACCDHKSCQGQCIELEGGEVGCWCLGLAGGCPEGLICCKYRGGCTDPHHCAP